MAHDNSYLRFLPDEGPTEDPRSDYLRAREKSGGNQVNCCKTDGFGCADSDLDMNGHCPHVVGWTLPGTERFYNPLEDMIGANGQPNGRKFVNGNKKLAVREHDRLVRISESCRVYRSLADQERYAEDAGETPAEPQSTEPGAKSQGKKRQPQETQAA